MLFETTQIQLIPFTSSDWTYLANWYYDGRYNDIFRHAPKVLTQQDFENYPQRISGDVYFVLDKTTKEYVGFVQASSDWKVNRGFYFGIMLTVEAQKQGHAPHCLGITLDYYFNRLGYNKAILEILASRHDIVKWLTGAGFTEEARYRDEVFIDGKYQDELRYAILASEFNELHKTTVNAWKV